LSQRTGKQMYAEGEMIQRADPVPDAIGFIAEGSVTMVVYTQDGIEVPVGHREAGDYIGTTALTRQRVVSGVIATADTTLISVQRDAISTVVRATPRLARSLGEAIEMRRAAAAAALAGAVGASR
jgi:CRP-like cAMP-binding protein